MHRWCIADAVFSVTWRSSSWSDGSFIGSCHIHICRSELNFSLLQIWAEIREYGCEANFLLHGENVSNVIHRYRCFPIHPDNGIFAYLHICIFTYWYICIFAYLHFCIFALFLLFYFWSETDCLRQCTIIINMGGGDRGHLTLLINDK